MSTSTPPDTEKPNVLNSFKPVILLTTSLAVICETEREREEREREKERERERERERGEREKTKLHETTCRTRLE